jgi:hypothetical protein
LSDWRKHRRWFVAQVVVWGATAAVLRVAVVPAETCPPADRPAIRQAIERAESWLVRDQRQDGRFLYGYSSDEDEVSSDYNSTRHAGVMDVLYRLGSIRAADAGLRYVRGNLVRHAGWTAFAPAGEDANVGANALLVVALVHRREVTGDERYDELARRVGRFLVAQRRPDGSVLQYWRPATRRSVPGVFGTYSTGEAFYALALLHRTSPRTGWARHAHDIAAYLATRRDRAEGYAYRQADHWAAYGLAELAPAGLTEAEAEYGRWLAGYFSFLIRFESQQTGRLLDDLVEGGGALGTTGEGAVALWRLAGEDPRLADLRGELGDRITCLAGIIVDQQVGPAETANPLERGAWFADRYTQMDDQQHAIAALLGASEVLR